MCVNPITIKNPSNPRRGMTVPCGVCLECKKKYQASWMVRIEQEYKRYNKGVFFTLTYENSAIPRNLFWRDTIYKTLPDYRYDGNFYFVNEDHTECIYMEDIYDESNGFEIVDFNSLKGTKIPEFYKDIKENGIGDRIIVFNSIRKKDVQEWNNRCRKAYRKATGNITKYFITSEYGPRTLRPHYHGVMFGIDAVDFKRYFKKDWVKHFGKEEYADVCVEVEDIKPDEGGIQYVTKYCSKGVFEHPFCAKNFFYAYKRKGEMIFSEYHSKHYERCIEYFDIDEPLVDLADKLISLGLGSNFLDNKRLMRYYEVGIDEVIDADLKEISRESAHWLGLDACEVDEEGNLYKRVNIQSQEDQPAYEFDELINYEGEKRFTYDKSPVRQFMKIGDKYYSKVYRFIEDHTYQECDIHCWDGTMYTTTLRDYLDNLQKKLVYKKNGNKKGQDKIFSYAMPKYYREKMFGDEVRHLFACIVAENHDADYKEQYREVRAANPHWKDVEVAIFIENKEEEERFERYRELSEQYKKFLNKSKI